MQRQIPIERVVYLIESSQQQQKTVGNVVEFTDVSTNHKPNFSVSTKTTTTTSTSNVVVLRFITYDTGSVQ